MNAGIAPIGIVFALLTLSYSGRGQVINADDPWIIWTQRSPSWSKIKALKLEATTWDSPFSRLYENGKAELDKFKYAISYNPVQNELVWSEHTTGGVYVQNLQDSLDDQEGSGAVKKSARTALLSPLINVTGLAADTLTGAVYFVERNEGWIGVLDSSKEEGNYKVLYDRHQIQVTPHNVAVDPYLGALFWTESNGVTGRIMMAPASGGTAPVILVGTDLTEPYGLTLDPRSQIVYFVDRERGVLESIRYDGKERQMVFRAPYHSAKQDTLFDVVLANDQLFVTTEESARLYVIGKASGELEQFLDVDAYIYGITTTAWVQLQPRRKHKCTSLSCEHICLNKGDFRGQCACQDGYFVNPDGSCSVATSPQFLYSTGRDIFSVDVSLNASTELVTRGPARSVVSGVTDARALAMHVDDQLLFFSDNERDSDNARDAIYRESLATPATEEWRTEMEITVQTGDVQGMAVDWLSNTLYWSDYALQHIMVSQLDGRYHSILLSGLSPPPRGLALHPIAGLLFFTTDNSLIRYSFRNGGKQEVIIDGLFQGQVVAVDVRVNRVYVTDTAASQIHVVDTDGSDHRVLDMRSAGMYGVTPFQNLLTWTKDGLGLQFSPRDQEKVYAQYTPLVSEAKESHLYDVLTYGDYVQPIQGVSSVECGTSNGGCAQLCFPAGTRQRLCGCAIGYTLNLKDGTTCDAERVNGETLLFVDPYHKQLYTVSATTTSTTSDPGRVHAVPSRTSLPSRPVSVDYVPETGRVYWIDQGRRQIKEASMSAGSQGEDRVIYQYDKDSPEPKKLVAGPGKVYYIAGDSIMAIITTEQDRDAAPPEAIVNNIIQPRTLVADFNNGVVYWSSHSRAGDGQIEWLDGSGRGVLVDKMGQITGLDLSKDASQLYFCDRQKGYLGYVDVNLTTPQTHILIEAAGTEFSGIAINAEGYIFFTAWNDKGIRRINLKQEKIVPERVTLPVFARITDIKYFQQMHAEANTGDDNPLIFPIPLAFGLLLLLGLLLFSLIYGLRICKKRSLKETTHSTEELNKDDSDVEWMDLKNASLYNIRSSNGSKPDMGSQELNDEPSVFVTNATINGNSANGKAQHVTNINTGGECKGNTQSNSNHSNGSINITSQPNITPYPLITTISTALLDIDTTPSCYSNGGAHGVVVNVPPPPPGCAVRPPQLPKRNSQDISRPTSRVLTTAAPTPLAVTGVKTWRFKKRSSKNINHNAPVSKPYQPQSTKQFDLADNQKVATVIQRIVGRMRNKLSSVKWTERDNIPQHPPDITINMPVSSSSKPEEKGLKTLPANRTMFFPPKLHDPPRGWAPASHNVPLGGIKSSWGKAKIQKVLEQQQKEQRTTGVNKPEEIEM